MYQIFQRLLDPSIQEKIPVMPLRLVIHSTANPSVTDESHYKWLNSARQHGWANYYLDWDSISQLVPEGMLAPAQGPTANRDSISIELCEAVNPNDFIQVWQRGVWLASDILVRYGWGVDKMLSHADVSALFPAETDHQDPLAYLQKFGHTWADFEGAVQVELTKRLAQFPPAADWQFAAVKKLQDLHLLSELRHPMQQVTWWEFSLLLDRAINR